MSERASMPPKLYIETQMRVIEMGKIADSLDLDLFLQCISNAETLAPILDPTLDPTLYRKAQANMEAIKRLALIAKQMKLAYGEAFKAILETQFKQYVEDKAIEKTDT
jgi:hypothetical protein